MFDIPSVVIAAMTGIEIKTYSKLIQKLINVGWVVRDQESTSIRSYAKWNPPDQRGGKRPGAGRPSRIGNQNEIKPKSNRNQNEIKTKSKANQVQPAPSPSPSPSPNNQTTLSASKPPTPSKPRKPHWSEPAGSALAGLDGCPKNGPWPLLNKLARKHTEAAVLDALSSAPEFVNWGHAAGWLAKVAESKHANTPASQDYEDRIE